MFKNTKEVIYYSYPKRPPSFPTAEGYFIFETMKHIDVLTLV